MAHRRIGPHAVLGSLAAFQAAGGEAYPHLWSTSFNGLDENIRKYTTAVKVGYVDNFTIMMWGKMSPASIADYLFEIEGSANDWNGVKLYTNGVASGLRLALYSNGGSPSKLYDVTDGDGVKMHEWALYGVTWNGDTGDVLRLYRDGVELAMTKSTDGLVEQVDNVSKITVPTDGGTSARCRGLVHSFHIWDEPLTSGEMLACYNSGEPFDYRNDSGDYTSSANLIRHWWLGHEGPVEGGVATWFNDLVSGDFDLGEIQTEVTSGNIVGDYPGGPAYWADSYKSMEFSGSEYLRTLQSTHKLGPNNAWSVELWLKPDIVGANDFVYVMNGDTGGTENSLIFYSTNSTSMKLDLYDSASVKKKAWSAIPMSDEAWNHFVFTFDGTQAAADQMKVYKDGSLQTPTKGTDNACTQNDQLYEVALGASIGGSAAAKILAYHSASIWTTVLTADEVTALYNSGDGIKNLKVNSGDYVSSATLCRYFLLGKWDGWIGRDWVDSDIDLLDNAVGMTAADIVDEYPGDS